MASTVQFDLVSPERRLASFAATEVQIPGAMGDMTAMQGHAATITSLRPGLLRVVAAEGTKSYVVTGGFAEISASGVSVLAEQAVPLEEMTAAKLDALVAEATAAAALGADKDAADKAVADLAAMRAAAGL
jgi:F-type H+-transporting ATPase subunit epsilon